MKYIVLFGYLLFSLPLFSSEEGEFQPMLEECGEYQVSGIVRLIDHSPKVVVHEKTQSQFIITLPFEKEIKLAAYLDYPILLNATFTKKLTQLSKAHAASVTKDPVMRIPHPLNPMDTGFRLISAQDCKDR